MRFKDLRRTGAVTADMAGLNLGQMKAGMGHGLEETTVRYTNRQVTLELEDAERVAKQMGIGVPIEEKKAASGGKRRQVKFSVYAGMDTLHIAP